MTFLVFYQKLNVPVLKKFTLRGLTLTTQNQKVTTILDVDADMVW